MKEDVDLSYHHELEKAARQMVLVRRSETLVKLILRTIVRILYLEHASFLLYERNHDAYVAHFSRGRSGLKVPRGFAKMSKENPLIRYFTSPRLRIAGTDCLYLSQINHILDSSQPLGEEAKDLMVKIRDQFMLYNAQACIPGFFRDRLIFALFLGSKADGAEVSSQEVGFLSILCSDAVMAIQNAWFFQDLEAQLHRNKQLFVQAVKALSSAIEAKDPYTMGHAERVAHYAVTIAKELKKMGKISHKNIEVFFESLRISSLLHDIGKIGVSETILNKKDILSGEERAEIEKHPLVGASILSRVDEFCEPILGVKYHHERYDGKGYPEALKGEQIPLIAQIIAIADSFDAMTTDRPYRSCFSRDEALRVLGSLKDKQFSAVVVEALTRVYRRGEI
ncbi:MAG: HD domain-containing protein [Candidatus Omnitrophica bacterium]|nr:HD domain-containing protein [Candidatus Omnitrophota bacterium]MBD3269160.1 HD domain-containing protein [Candidatus Omnitrophota bacterium]